MFTSSLDDKAVTGSRFGRLQLGRLASYLYFVRFSLFIWSSMLALVALDSSGMASMTRGILTPFNRAQWFLSGVAVTLSGWSALLAARITCAYGPYRFDVAPPRVLAVGPEMRGRVFWISQTPGWLLLSRMTYDVIHEREGRIVEVTFALAVGVAAAFLIWCALAVLYHWTAVHPEKGHVIRALVVPRYRFLRLKDLESLPQGSLKHLSPLVSRLLCKLGPGYERDDGTLRGGHWIAVLLLTSTFVGYTLLMPIIAPVELARISRTCHVVSWCLFAYVLYRVGLPAVRMVLRAQRKTMASTMLAAIATILSLTPFVLLGTWPNSPFMMPVLVCCP